MAVIAEVRVPASDFVLPHALSTMPRVRIEINRVVAGTEGITPYFWVYGDNLDDFEQALRDDPDTRELLTLEEPETDERFFRVVWNQRVPTVLTAVSNSEATILDAVNDRAGNWDLKILLPDRDALSHCRDYCIENDIAFELQRVYQPENPPERAQYGLTADQQEALEATYHGGYFNVPRDHTLTEIASTTGISRNAMSNRIRRGLRNLLSNTVIHEE